MNPRRVLMCPPSTVEFVASLDRAYNSLSVRLEPSKQLGHSHGLVLIALISVVEVDSDVIAGPSHAPRVPDHLDS
jgi:hypothetical protein